MVIILNLGFYELRESIQPSYEKTRDCNNIFSFCFTEFNTIELYHIINICLNDYRLNSESICIKFMTNYVQTINIKITISDDSILYLPGKGSISILQRKD